MENRSNKTGLVWGRILFGLGVFLVLVGLFMWAFMTLLPAVSPNADLTNIGSGALVGGLCCFGPPAFLGFIMAIIGIVLWTANRN